MKLAWTAACLTLLLCLGCRSNFMTSLRSSYEFEEVEGPRFADDLGTNPLTITGVALGDVALFGKCGRYDRMRSHATILHADQKGLD